MRTMALVSALNAMMRYRPVSFFDPRDFDGLDKDRAGLGQAALLEVLQPTQ